MAAGEIDIFGKLVARTAAGKICDAEQVDGLDEKIAASITPPEKEVISVLTASDTAPGSPDEDDLWIDTANNNLSKYNGLIWVLESPSTEVVYVTLDTSDIYVWNGTAFVMKTNEVVDNTIYIKNINTGLDAYDEKGMWTVCYSVIKNHAAELTWYTLSVSYAIRTGGRIISSQIGTVTNQMRITQVLSNAQGYKTRYRDDTVETVHGETTTTEGTWSSWESCTYASKDYVETKVSTEATARAAADDDILDLLYACF